MTTTPVGMRCPECARQRTRVRTMGATTDQPVVTYALIAICVVVFIGELAGGGGMGTGQIASSKLFEHGALSKPAVADGDYWRLLSSGFLHASFTHILFNMLSLYILGSLLEPVAGHARFALIYFVSLVCGSLGALLMNPDTLTVGASGAIFGLLTAAIFALRNRGVNPMESGLLVWLGLNLVFTFAVPHISVGGHIGGLIGGAIAGILLFELPSAARIPAALTNLLVVAVGAAAVVAAVAVAGS
jgi:membrane associated rhomboid family serine protease